MTSETPYLLVLAAGMGSRYGGLKQLDPIGPNGETIMDYSIHDARKAGFTRVIFLIREEIFEIFREKIGAKYSDIIEVNYAFQEKDDLPDGFSCPENREKPWGTGQAVWSARKELERNSFAVINADDFYGAETFEVLFQELSSFSPILEEKKLSCSMIGFRLSDTMSDHGAVSRGICQTENGFLNSVKECTGIQGNPIVGLTSGGEEIKLSGEELVSMNVWAFPSGIFKLLETSFVEFLSALSDPAKEEFYLPFAVDQWIKGGIAQIRVQQAKCQWMGVTYKEDKPRVQNSISKLVNEGAYPRSLIIN